MSDPTPESFGLALVALDDECFILCATGQVFLCSAETGRWEEMFVKEVDEPVEDDSEEFSGMVAGESVHVERADDRKSWEDFETARRMRFVPRGELDDRFGF